MADPQTQPAATSGDSTADKIMNSTNTYFQPIIRGIQNVGSVQIMYRYNFKDSDDHYKLPIATGYFGITKGNQDYVDCGTDGLGIPVAGFRLDSEFLRANPQIASSFTIPVLGGGGISLTNNNRTGTLNLVCPRVAAPNTAADAEAVGAMIAEGQASGNGIGVKSSTPYYDMVTLAQLQQGQPAGDAYGAQITIKYNFCGVTTTVVFEGCTVASVDPLGLSGNDAVNYGVVLNYLNWTLDYTAG